jgi:hypothetical protein
MSILKREKKDSVKPKELKELAGSSREDVGMKDASITLKSALGLKGRKSGDGDGSIGNRG